MLKGKSLTDFTNNLFLPIIYCMTDVQKWLNACNFIETANIYPNLNDEQQFKLNKINEIKDYFIVEIKERELMSKRHCKYMVSFDYFDKSFIFLICNR